MIVIVDFGSQTAHLIGRRLRQLGVQAEYVQPEDALKQVRKMKPTGIIFSGGPSSVYEQGAPEVDKEIYRLGVPILGLCYGWQLMAKQLGGGVKAESKEYGPEQLVIKAKQTKTGILPDSISECKVWMSHGDSVTALPDGFEVVGSTKSVTFAAVQAEAKKLYGLQFHPEVEHTEHGIEILKEFVLNVCGETLDSLKLDPEAIVETIKYTVGKAKVICAVSGGVDSSVAAFLIGKAIGRQLIPVYVESGLMRKGNRERVEYLFVDLVEADLVVVEAEERFMSALKGVTDPEEKRKIIGKLYVDIFQEEASKHPEAVFLGQGTIYSDVIESKGSKKASKIKSHHNVGGLPEEMRFTLLEPLREYYKDEVRELGRMVGVPDSVLTEHPFPGPGYAVRIRGEVTPKRLAQERQADGIVMEEMREAGLLTKVFQCFAVMTGAMSTAVKGDARAFAEVVAVRAYESQDVMTSQWAHVPHEVLARISSRIVNEVPDVSRVVYDITTKPPATMEWE